jgi:DNA-binding CsgD family transcriptional regulator
MLLTDVARLGGAKDVVDRLSELAQICDSDFVSARADLAIALVAGDPEKLLTVAGDFAAIGADLLAVEAATAAASIWHRRGQLRQATAALARFETCVTRCEGARTPLLSTAKATAPLTGREQEVALLAAAGVPSKDIAEILYLSVRTVDNHLQRIYKKLGVTTPKAAGRSPRNPVMSRRPHWEAPVRPRARPTGSRGRGT